MISAADLVAPVCGCAWTDTGECALRGRTDTHDTSS